MGAGHDPSGALSLRIGDWDVAPGPPGADADQHEFTYRARFHAEPPAAGEEVHLHLGGLATIAQVELNGERVLESSSMWLEHTLDVGALLRDDNQLVIRILPLAPLLAERRKPRARWRTRLVDEGNLRWFRTTLLGRMPGTAPGAPPIGPWRPVTLQRHGPGPWLRSLRLEGRRAHVDVAGAQAVEVELAGRPPAGVRDGVAELDADGLARWFPHTHGHPALHDLRVIADGGEIARRRVGFRELGSPGDPLTDGLDLHINGVAVFARGAVWTPVADEELRPTLEAMRDAGMNMVRIAGTGCYESAAFHDLCDELGLLVWQDFMFANMDYPVTDPGFRALVEREARQLLTQVGGRPSLAVLCGNSEVEQQVAMLGLDPELGRGELFGELLPALVAESAADAVYFPSSPSGGERPFRPDRGIAHWFGVGGYRCPLEETRRAGVRFASECLAFANVPDDGDTDWVPRDSGSEWDFADAREHYRAMLHGDDRSPAAERAVTGEAMAEVFGEWRRPGSSCRGGIVLWLRDLQAGQGWGVLDHEGRPKAAYDWLATALAPVAVWTTDEGLGGVHVHMANDRGEPLDADLRVALYRDFELRVDEALEHVTLDPHSGRTLDLEGVTGRFADASYAYRFGPPQHHAIVVSLEQSGVPLSQSVRFPAGRPAAEPAAALGLEIDGRTIRSRRLVYGARAPGAAGVFVVEPGVERQLPPGAHSRLQAANLLGGIGIPFRG